jgi:hypothetical protein
VIGWPSHGVGGNSSGGPGSPSSHLLHEVACHAVLLQEHLLLLCLRLHLLLLQQEGKLLLLLLLLLRLLGTRRVHLAAVPRRSSLRASHTTQRTRETKEHPLRRPHTLDVFVSRAGRPFLLHNLPSP